MKTLFAATACVVSLTGAAVAQDLPARYNMEMLPGSIQLIDIDRPYSDVMIANPAVVDTNVVTGTRIAVVSKVEGRTNVLFLDVDGDPVANLEVRVVSDAQGLARRPVTVRTFTDQGKKLSNSTYYCETDSGQNGACSFASHKVDKSDSSITASTVINLGTDGAGPRGSAETTAR